MDAHLYTDTAKAWGYVTAEALDAEVYIEAISGIGVVKNCLTRKGFDSMPVLYKNTLPLETNLTWNNTKYEADATLMLIGPNDFVNKNPPTDEEFQDGYLNFMEQVSIRCHVIIETILDQNIYI